MSLSVSSKSSNHGTIHILLALGMGAALGFACVVGDWISATFVFLIIFMAYLGYWSGVIKIAAGLLGLLAAIRFAQPVSPFVSQFCHQLFEVPERYEQIISIGCAGILVAIAVMLTLRIAAHFVFRSKPQWKGIDRWMGAAFGAVQGVVISAIVLFSAVILEPIAEQQMARRDGEVSVGYLDELPAKVISFTQLARNSSMGTIITAMEPLQDRFNEQVQEMTESITTNQEFEGQFGQTLMQMVQEFRDDPEAVRIISSRSGIEQEKIRSILDSQEFEEAVQDPRVWSEATKKLRN